LWTKNNLNREKKITGTSTGLLARPLTFVVNKRVNMNDNSDITEKAENKPDYLRYVLCILFGTVIGDGLTLVYSGRSCPYGRVI
jgi:hypothetical protein